AVVPQADLLTEAKKWAAQIGECSPMSIRASKQAVLQGLELTLPEAIGTQFKMPAVAALFKSEDFKEGPMAFAQKRAPEWKGR
ncbi:MAG: enoyl-CoA hydratase-related protein, partial [Pseudomonadota bacterium]